MNMHVIKMSEVFGVAFLLTILSSSGYTQDISPQDQLVSYVSGSASFSCLVSLTATESANDMTWTLNSMPLEESDLIDIIFDVAIEVGRLTLRRLSLLQNATLVRCQVHFVSGRIVPSNPSTLIVDPGVLSEVRFLDLLELDGVAISLNWTRPLPLEFANLNSDVTYIVDVVNSTATVLSERGIIVTEFIYPLPPKAVCDRLTFTVTPVNVVGPGTQRTVQYEPTEVPQLSDAFHTIRNQVLLLTVPVCQAELSFVDIDTGEFITLGDTDLTIAVTNITFTTQQLRQNRRYNVTIEAFNAAGSNNSVFTLSTHDILDASLSKGSIKIEYIEQSLASGALLAFMFLNADDGTLNFTRSAYLTVERNASLNYTSPLNLHPGQYQLFVYDIEQDGKLQNGISYPASMENFSVEGNRQDNIPSENGNCQITTTSSIITADCEPTNSFVIGFQMIVQADNLSKVGKLYVNRTTDLRTSASVVVEENGMYQVTIFAIRGDSGIVESSVEYSDHLTVDTTTTTTTTTTTDQSLIVIIASSVIGGAAIIVILIVSFLVIIYFFHKKLLK